MERGGKDIQGTTKSIGEQKGKRKQQLQVEPRKQRLRLEKEQRKHQTSETKTKAMEENKPAEETKGEGGQAPLKAN